MPQQNSTQDPARDITHSKLMITYISQVSVINFTTKFFSIREKCRN